VNLLHSDQILSVIKEVRPTHLLHLAWHVETGMQLNAAANLKWVKAGINLLEAFHLNGGQRIVVSGSCAEYDWQHGFLSERSTPLMPASLYGSCKHALQTIFDTYCREVGLSYAWGRIFFTFGPMENPNRLVASVVRSLLAQKEARCSHGNQVRDYIYVADVADALVRLLFSPMQGPVNIASGEPVKLKWIIQRIADLIGSSQDLIKLGALPGSANEPRIIIGDVDRLRTELQWSPQYSLDTGLMETIAWWEKQSGCESEIIRNG
jgi:nucleoside-diphosphate-sugar epimerase